MVNTAPQAPVAAAALQLFCVMSPWHNQDPEQGTFEEKVWAEDDEAAKRELAVCMAACADSGCKTDQERAGWVEDHLLNTGHLMVALPVIETVRSDLLDLLRGPTEETNEAVKADLEAILAILGKRCKV